jgi:hypothetical protein
MPDPLRGVGKSVPDLFFTNSFRSIESLEEDRISLGSDSPEPVKKIADSLIALVNCLVKILH